MTRPASGCTRSFGHHLLSILVVLAMAALPALASTAAKAPSTTSTVDLPDNVSFTEHVAPVLYKNCVSCHRPGDVAPMSLLSFQEARPWAKSIQKAVVSREMPPWDADPRYGHFANDISLSAKEIALISRWVDLGAPEGDPALLPAPPKLAPPGTWKMGSEPDYVIELAPVDVAAGGPDLFVTQVFGMEIPEGKWVRAIELLPGNTEILHHVVTYLGPFGMSEDDESNAGVNRLIYLNEAAKRQIGMAEAPSIGGVYVAGSPPMMFPEGTGHPLKPDQMVTLNMHYHPSGNAGTDASKVGLYFGEGELEKEITTAFAADPGLVIPPGAADHHEQAVYLFSQDSKILSLLPHMHQRGKSMKYTLVRPNGSEEILLDVPAYDYDWQNIYRFQEPVGVEKGSFVKVDASWDNSAENPVNPDPTITVPWGDGTSNEMLVAFIDFVVDEGKKPRPVRGKDQIEQLLSRHDPASSYEIKLDGMGFGGPWGLVIPPSGEGTFYLTLGSLMFSTSVPDIERVGDEIVLNTGMLTSGGGTRTPVSFLAKTNDDGSIEGELFFGRKIDTTKLDEFRGKGRRFSGASLAAAPAGTAGF